MITMITGRRSMLVIDAIVEGSVGEKKPGLQKAYSLAIETLSVRLFSET
jgi:hypothetical protein